MAVNKDEKAKTWYAVFKTKDQLTGKTVWHKKRGFKLKRDAQDWERDERRRSGSAASASLKEMTDRYLLRNEASDATRSVVTTSLRIRCADLMDRPVNSLTPSVLNAWRNKLIADDKYSVTTKNATISHLRSVLMFASEIYGTPSFKGILKYLKKPKERQEMQVWTVEEFNTFLEEVHGEVYRLYFKTVFWTGMRRGEALALRKSDLHDGWIDVHATVINAQDGLKPPKTASSNRSIRIDRKLQEDLRPLLDTPGPFLFGGETTIAPASVRKAFVEAVERSGVKPIRLHDLRHSHATLLINNGVNIVAVSKRLGHSSINQTLSTYTHLLKKTDDEMMETIEKLTNC